MSYKIFIDGKEGTTGLKIAERFAGRSDIELLEISEEKRKDTSERKKLINASDFTFLCLPDDAAREAVTLAEGNVRIIDASTAHRTNPDWAYGFPELSKELRKKREGSARVAVPG
ncbi:MAG: N-acetyl-gamma-glutamyl-phosphate reductase, partial [Oscillospiraceae bacterium]|nr:N-acetyl-gamma-glutamyl-phosphate reductase [Oscillospiraceae bacterium]